MANICALGDDHVSNNMNGMNKLQLNDLKENTNNSVKKFKRFLSQLITAIQDLGKKRLIFGRSWLSVLAFNRFLRRRQVD